MAVFYNDLDLAMHSNARFVRRQRRTARRKAERDAKLQAEAANVANGERIAALSSQSADKIVLPANSFGPVTTAPLE